VRSIGGYLLATLRVINFALALTLIGVGSVFILAGSLLAQGMVELKTERNLKHGG